MLHSLDWTIVSKYTKKKFYLNTCFLHLTKKISWNYIPWFYLFIKLALVLLFLQFWTMQLFKHARINAGPVFWEQKHQYRYHGQNEDHSKKDQDLNVKTKVTSWDTFNGIKSINYSSVLAFDFTFTEKKIAFRHNIF